MATNHRNKITLVIFLGILMGFLILNIWMISPYLIAILMGAMLATLCRPFYIRLLRRGWGRKTAALVMTLGVIILAVGPISTVVTIAVKQGISLFESLSKEGAFDLESITQKLSEWPAIRGLIGSPQELGEQVREQVRNFGATGSALLLNLISGVPDKILQVTLALLACFFLLLDGGRFISWLQDKIPMDRDVRASLFRAFRDTTISVIWATLAAATAQAMVMFSAYLATGLDGKYLAAAAMFFFAWIPFIGSTPVWVTGAIILWVRGEIGNVVIMTAFGIVCGIVDNVVRAFILKGRSAMHPLVSLIAIFGGIQMFGLFGVFFGPVMAAILLALLQVWPVVARRFQLLGEPAMIEEGVGEAGQAPAPLPGLVTRVREGAGEASEERESKEGRIGGKKNRS